MPAGPPALLSAVSRGSHKAVHSATRAPCQETGLEIRHKEFSCLEHCTLCACHFIQPRWGTKAADLSLLFQVAYVFLSLVLLLDSLVAVTHTINGWIFVEPVCLDALCTNCSLSNVREQV